MNSCSFEERLAAQRKEREMAKEELGFKKPLDKEEANEKKKQRLAAIGNLPNLTTHCYDSLFPLSLESTLLLQPMFCLFSL